MPQIVNREPRHSATSPPGPKPDRVMEFLWITTGLGAAGGAYGIVVSSMVVAAIAFESLIEWWGGVASLPGPAELFSLTLIAATSLTFFNVAAIVGFWMWSLLLAPLCFLARRIIASDLSSVWFGTACGGLVGAVATVSLAIMEPGFGRSLSVPVLLLFGPALSTIVGQLGGAWGGWRAELEKARRKEREATLLDDGWLESIDEASEGDVRPTRGIRFGTRQLLFAITGVGVLLGVLRFFGLPLEVIVPATMVWLVYQGATLFVGARAIRWSLSRRPGAVGRST